MPKGFTQKRLTSKLYLNERLAHAEKTMGPTNRRYFQFIGVLFFCCAFEGKCVRSTVQVSPTPVSTSLIPATFGPEFLLKSVGGLTPNSSTPLILENLRISNPGGPCINLTANQAPIIIRNSELGPCSYGVMGTGTQKITIQNNLIHDISDYAIQLTTTLDADVLDNTILNAGFGINIRNNNASPMHLNVSYNTIYNITGNCCNGNTGSTIQLNTHVGPDAQITCNSIFLPYVNHGQGPGDTVSMFNSGGVPGDPVRIIGNRVNGCGGYSFGGSIMLADGGGVMNNVVASDNLVVNGGPYSLEVAAGASDESIINNYAFNDSLNLFGQAPIQTFNWYDWNNPNTCWNITVKGNFVYDSANRGGYSLSCLGDKSNPGYNFAHISDFPFPAINDPRPSCTH